MGYNANNESEERVGRNSFALCFYSSYFEIVPKKEIKVKK